MPTSHQYCSPFKSLVPWMAPIKSLWQFYWDFGKDPSIFSNVTTTAVFFKGFSDFWCISYKGKVFILSVQKFIWSSVDLIPIDTSHFIFNMQVYIYQNAINPFYFTVLLEVFTRRYKELGRWDFEVTDKMPSFRNAIVIVIKLFYIQWFFLISFIQRR